MNEYKFSISQTIQARQFEPIMYTARGDSAQACEDGLQELLKVHPPLPIPKEQAGVEKINKELALASENTNGYDDHHTASSPKNSGNTSSPAKSDKKF